MSFGLGFLLGAMAGAAGTAFILMALNLGAKDDQERQKLREGKDDG